MRDPSSIVDRPWLVDGESLHFPGRCSPRKQVMVTAFSYRHPGRWNSTGPGRCRHGRYLRLVDSTSATRLIQREPEHQQTIPSRSNVNVNRKRHTITEILRFSTEARVCVYVRVYQT
jgi:hypothetical protein